MAETKTDAAATSEGAEKTTTEKTTETTSTPVPEKTTTTEKTVVEPAKTDTGKTSDPERKADESTTQSKAPAAYALTVPEQGKAFLEDADLRQIETFARANDWSNDDAQAALDEHVANLQAQSDRYLAQMKADPDYGGASFDASKELARRVVDRIRPEGHARRDPFLRFMGRGGAGNHPEVVGFLADLGKLMGEDAPGFTRSSGGGDKRDTASKLYDHETSRALDKATA